jgi:hypothetical protein
MSVAPTRPCMHCLVAFSLLLGVVAEVKLKPTTPSSAGITPSRYVVDCCFIPKIPVRRPRYLALLVCAYMFFVRAASCFTDQSFVSCSLIMYRAWANVLLPPKPVLNSRNIATHYKQVWIPYGRPRATGRPGDRGTNQNWRARNFRVAHV